MKHNTRVVTFISAIGMLISSLVGLFFTDGGSRFTVTNIYGQQVELYGDGIYAYNSLLKTGACKGTDMVMLLISLTMLCLLLWGKEKKRNVLLITGLQSCILYASICLVTGVSFNRLFPVYLITFSTALFAFVLNMTDLVKCEIFNEAFYQEKHTKSGGLLIVGGCSVLVWLMFIVEALVTGAPTGFIEVYTTEPTFVIDLGLILPASMITGLGVIRKKKSAYVFASVLYTLITCVGLCVIAQTIAQLKLGIVLEIGQLFGLVISFVILGAVATILNYKLLKNVCK